MTRAITYLAIYITCFVCITNCGTKGTKSISTKHVAGDSLHRKLSIASDKVQSVKARPITLNDSVLGLFFGHFNHTPVSAKLHHRYDSMEEAIETDEDYFTLDDRFYATVSEHEKNYFYVDPLYGVNALRQPNAISIHLTQITSDSMIGRSICAGNERPLKMTSMQTIGHTVRLTAQEPVDDKYDGKFEFIIDSKSGTMTGKFIPYRDKMPHKTLTAQSSSFEYKPEGEEWAFDSDYFGKNISLERLDVEDVENQSKPRLRILRNIIYARHGYSFKNKDVREFFESYEWYIPYSTDVRADLTDIEKENIALIKRYETYADDYYDDFGR